MTDDCWLYAGTQNWQGYGQFPAIVDGVKRTVRAHRAMYESVYGAIPEGLVIDHLCKVTSCINPGHLEPVTQRENIMRGTSPWAKHKLQTHCVNGHEFNEANTGTGSRGERYCKTCRSRHQKNWYAAKRAAGLEEGKQP